MSAFPVRMDSGASFSLQLREGIDLFNRELFYECHDVIEEIWLQESSDRRPLLQGLIQSAVAFHHFQHGRYGAARSMLDLAVRKLENSPPVFQGIQMTEFVQVLRHWKSSLDALVSRGEKAEMSFPRIKVR